MHPPSHFLRQRFLFAMGLVACTKEKPADTTMNETIALPSATATASATETASATPSAPPPTVTTPLGPPGGGGGCGTVIVCDPAPATAPKIAAAKPFERCPATTPQAMNGSDPHREGPFDEEVTKDRRVKSPNVCCYKTPRALCGGGRPLRAGQDFVVASHVARTDWSAELSSAVADPERAERFLADAAAEHASIASFARVSLQLLALGAPPALIEEAHRSALDEIEHARLCYALAERRGAPRVGPGPLAVDRAPFETSMASFVRDTFLDGCIAETVAAIDARARAADGDDTERAVLERIADDEARHAELAWRMLAWAVRTDASAPASLRRAIDEASSTDLVIRDVVLPCSEALLAG